MPRFFFASALVATLGLGSIAWAQGDLRADGRVALLGGYDSNASLAREPGERLRPGMGASFRELPGSGVLALRGEAGAELGGATWADARVGFDLGWLTLGERRGEGVLTLRAGHRGRLAFGRLGVSVGRYGASFGLDDASFTRARLSAGLGSERLRATASLLGGLRFYDEASQRDRSVGGELMLSMRRGPVRFRVAARLHDRFSNSPEAVRVELGAWSELSVDISRLTLGASAAWQQRFFQSSEQNGFELTGDVSARVRVTRALAAVALLRWGTAHGSSDALDYGRVAALAGLELRFTHPEAPSWGEVEPDEDAPVRVEGRRIVFRVHFPNATQVRAIGSFNHWNAAEGELHVGENGSFEGRFEVSPGRYRYRLLVDGEPRLPEGAHGVADDFGGVDAIIDVPEAD